MRNIEKIHTQKAYTFPFFCSNIFEFCAAVMKSSIFFMPSVLLNSSSTNSGRAISTAVCGYATGIYVRAFIVNRVYIFNSLKVPQILS